jgi:hypothetical protein
MSLRLCADGPSSDAALFVDAFVRRRSYGAIASIRIVVRRARCTAFLDHCARAQDACGGGGGGKSCYGDPVAATHA